MNNERIDVIMIAPSVGRSGGGGIATYVTSLINILSQRVKIKRIVTLRDQNIFNKIYMLISSLLITFIYLIGRRKNTVAHIHTSSRNSFLRKSLYIRIIKYFNVPIILHLHAPDFHEYYEESDEKQRAYIRKIFLMADKIIVLSNSWKEWYINTIEKNPPTVIYNGVDDFMVSDEQISKRNNNILFMGTLCERKGTYDLLKAFQLVLHKHSDAKLILAGGGEIDKCKILAKNLDIISSVDFVGWIDYEKKKVLLNNNKVFVLPSYNEGFPLTILEAMSARLPVISTIVGGIPEEIENHESGFLINPGDIEALSVKINDILGDNELTDYISENARKRYLEHFRLSEIVKDIENIYDDLIFDHNQ